VGDALLSSYDALVIIIIIIIILGGGGGGGALTDLPSEVETTLYYHSGLNIIVTDQLQQSMWQNASISLVP